MSTVIPKAIAQAGANALKPLTELIGIISLVFPSG